MEKQRRPSGRPVEYSDPWHVKKREEQRTRNAKKKEAKQNGV